MKSTITIRTKVYKSIKWILDREKDGENSNDFEAADTLVNPPGFSKLFTSTIWRSTKVYDGITAAVLPWRALFKPFEPERIESDDRKMITYFYAY